MAEFPALPLWTDAYLADTADLNEREHGCYLILLMIAWRRPDCALPNDMKWMHRCLNAYCGGHLHGNRFNRLIPKLLNRFFELGSDEKWHQKRLEKEMNFLRKKDEYMRDLALKRWSRPRKNNGLGDADASAPAYTPTPTPTPKEERKEDIIQNEPAKKYALEHGCVKLTEHHLKQWLEAFPNVSVVGELIAKEPWLSQQKSWFNAAAGWLAKAEREAKKPNGAAEKPAEYDAYWQKI
jgi:uncharacterized protein YdaU (DUF1376 family)